MRHLLPTMGLRVEFRQSQKSLAYSCDTEPCPQMVTLAAGVDVLIHEAAGDKRGHSSASQAAGVARDADVGSLYLIHYPVNGFDPGPMLEDAQKIYPGKIALAEDLMTLEF
jgi:ribonuclease Z